LEVIMTKTRWDKAIPSARVVGIEDDGRFFAVQFQRADGEIVIAQCKRVGWRWAPRAERERAFAVAALPPKADVLPNKTGRSAR
jgi:hypothetical protein